MRLLTLSYLKQAMLCLFFLSSNAMWAALMCVSASDRSKDLDVRKQQRCYSVKSIESMMLCKLSHNRNLESVKYFSPTLLILM